MITQEQLMVLFEECKTQLVNLGYIEILNNHYNIYINTKFKSVLGRIGRYLPNYFIIEINSRYLDVCTENAIKNTIMHELIHSIQGCMNHGCKWKNIAHQVNSFYGYNVQRTNSYKEYDSVYTPHALPYKYMIRCKHCNKIWKYKKTTNIIKELQQNNASSLYCPYCNHRVFELSNI